MKAGSPEIWANEQLAINDIEEYIEIVNEELKKDVPLHMPMVIGFVAWKRTCKTTFYRYAEKWDSLRRFSDWCESEMARMSLLGQYNATIAKLVLQAKHNYREKQDIISDNKVEMTIKFE